MYSYQRRGAEEQAGSQRMGGRKTGNKESEHMNVLRNMNLWLRMYGAVCRRRGAREQFLHPQGKRIVSLPKWQMQENQ